MIVVFGTAKRVVAVTAIQSVIADLSLQRIIAVFAAQPFLGGFDSAFQTVQEYTGFIAPGVVAVFLLGMFAQRTNSAGAFAALIISVVVSIALKFGAPDLQFVNRIWGVFLLCMLAGIVVSRFTAAPEAERILPLGDVQMKTTRGFDLSSILIIAILVALYAVFW